MSIKLQQLILYIAKQSADDPTFGATKLNKILFTIDFNSYGTLGYPISGSKYIRQQFGPCPSDVLRVRQDLIKQKKAALQKVEYKGKTQHRLVALEEADLSIFNQRELRFIDDFIEELKSVNATTFSDWSHTLLPWLLATEDEEIPYYTAFTLLAKPVSREGMLWAERRLQELKDSGRLP